MNYINIKTKEYPVAPEEFHRRFPGAPYPIPPTQLFRYGYAPVYETPKPTPGEFQQVIESAPAKTVSMVYRQTWEIVDCFTAEEAEAEQAAANKELAETDYKNMIRRRAAKLESRGEHYAALMTLKNIGE